jgi:hypothetical protein
MFDIIPDALTYSIAHDVAIDAEIWCRKVSRKDDSLAATKLLRTKQS